MCKSSVSVRRFKKMKEGEEGIAEKKKMPIPLARSYLVKNMKVKQKDRIRMRILS